MLISANFAPRNFDIVDFYGDETCFAWAEDKLVVFPYVESDESVATGLSTIVAPRHIRCLRSFNGRVFVLCQPAGIYKLLRTLKFSALSSTGIANGPLFYHVFTPENNWLRSQNKSTKVNRRLFRLEASRNGSYNLSDITLDENNSEASLRRAVCPDAERDRDVSVLANDKRLFEVTLDRIRLLYRSERDILDIVPILGDRSIAGMVLVTVDAAILVYTLRGKLKFHKVHLDGKVTDVCAGMSPDNSMWLAHIDGERIHYWSKTRSEETFRRIKAEPGGYLRVKNYKNKFVLCLSDTARLVRLDADPAELAKRPNADEFLRLDSDMFNGTDAIVEAICERAKELQRWNEILLDELDKQKRINIYSQKQRIVHLPAVRAQRIAGRLYASVKFQCALPLNCYLVVGLISHRRDNRCMMIVRDSSETTTTLDLGLADEKFDDETRLRVDLVTHARPSDAWCLVERYMEMPKNDRPTISNERIRFLNAKLEALRNIADEPDDDDDDDAAAAAALIAKLSAMKKSIRGRLNS